MKRKPSPAVAISLVALFFSLTGAGFAASRYIITSTHQIKPAVLQQLHGADGMQGQQGIQGPQGVVGATGSQGAAGTVDWSSVYTRTVTFDLSPALSGGRATIQCNRGDHALSGGYTGTNEVVTSDASTDDHAGWIVAAHLEPGASTGSFTASVVCVIG